MPVTRVLRFCPRLRHLSLAAHDCTPELYASLPKHLSSLLICSHREFSPLDTSVVAKSLDGVAHLHRLPRLTLYDPSAQGGRFDQLRNDPAWSKPKGRGTEIVVTPDPRILGMHIFLPETERCVRCARHGRGPKADCCIAVVRPDYHHWLILPPKELPVVCLPQRVALYRHVHY
jgi:hypothetical protein